VPITLSTLFCLPQDVWDLLSVEGVDLREDDHNLATGQLITVGGADVPAGSTSMTVSAIPVALLAGAQLTFDNGNMAAPATVRLTTAAAIGATTLFVEALTSAVYAAAQARDSGVNAATGARLLVGCRKGTSKVKLYCNSRYDDSELVRSGTVLDWATTVAAKFLCTRRAQGCPKSLKMDYDEAIEEMRMVQAGQLSIEDIGTRGVDWPSIVNVTVDPGYDGMRARVQPNISEQTPVSFGRYLDWNSALTLWQ
jgi:hypothetical protein